MKVRIVVKPSKVKDSNLWHWDVEEKIGDKWRMAYIFTDAGFHTFYGGTTEDRDFAIEFAKNSARRYIQDRQFYEPAIHKEIVKKMTYTEEISDPT